MLKDIIEKCKNSKYKLLVESIPERKAFNDGIEYALNIFESELKQMSCPLKKDIKEMLESIESFLKNIEDDKSTYDYARGKIRAYKDCLFIIPTYCNLWQKEK